MLNKPQFKFPIIYGTLAGFLCFCFLVVLDKFLKINPLGGKKEIGILFILIAMVLAISAVRSALGGAIQFAQGYGVCFSTTLIAGMVSVVLLYFFLVYFSPNCLPEYILETSKELLKNKDQIIKNGISEIDFNGAYKNIQITTVKSILIDDFIKKIFLGIIPSLMVSLYFRRRFMN